jgi:hypothetical protein
LALVMAIAAPAVAQEDRQAAAREFQEAQHAFAAGDYRLAAEQFEAAYKHKPHYASLWNAARARQRAGDIVRAANLYAKYLREAPPNTRDRNTAQASLREIAPKLGRIEVTAVGLDDVRLDGEPLVERMVYVNPGAHVVDAVKKGEGSDKDKAVRASPTVDAGQTVSVALVPPSVNEANPPPPANLPPKREVVEKEKEREPRRGWSPTVVVVGGILTALGAGLTVASGLDTLSQRSQFDKDPSQPNLDSGKSKQLRTNILLGATATMAVLTGACAIWLVDWHVKDRSVQAGAAVGAFTVRGTF